MIYYVRTNATCLLAESNRDLFVYIISLLHIDHHLICANEHRLSSFIYQLITISRLKERENNSLDCDLIKIIQVFGGLQLYHVGS